MERIPEEIVEKTWQEVAGFSPDRARKEIMKIGNSQPELLAFVTDSGVVLKHTTMKVYMGWWYTYHPKTPPTCSVTREKSISSFLLVFY